MSANEELMARLRAADPAAAQAQAADRAAVPGDAGDPGGRQRRAGVIAARRRREARRRTRTRTGVGAGLAAFCGALAIALGAGGGGPVTARLPGLQHVLSEAAHAAHMPGGTIVEITSDIRIDAIGTTTHRSTTWVRLARDGRVISSRSLTRRASGGPIAGLDTVSWRDGAGWWTRTWDPRSGTDRRSVGWMVPNSMLLEAARILRRAQAGRGRHVELRGEVVIGGRRAYRLWIDSIDDPPRLRGHKQLFVDAETYAPVRNTLHEQGTDVEGRPYVYDFDERIVERRVLPDTERNRRLLEVRGPTR